MIRLGSARWLAAANAATVVLLAAAILASVSPALTVYWPAAGAACDTAGLAPAAPAPAIPATDATPALATSDKLNALTDW